MPETARRRSSTRRTRTLDRCPACGISDSPAAPCPARCGRCDACCDCGGRQPRNTKEWSTHAAFFTPGEADALIPRYASCEIEFVGMRRYGEYLSNLVRRKQHGHTLKDASCGWEINTAPARGEAFAENLRAICDLLDAGGAKIDRRCGLHVHVNVGGIPGATRNLTEREGLIGWRRLLNVALLWARVEKSILGMVADSRLTNDYCQPLEGHFVNIVARHARDRGIDCPTGDAVAACYAAEQFTEEDARTVIETGLYGYVGSGARTSKAPGVKHAFWKNSCRTGALNLHSVFFHGTVEFRVHHGSLNYDKILNWSGLVAGLVHFAVTHSAQEIGALRGTPAEIIDRAVGNAQVAAWRKSRFAHFYERRSARRHGGSASSGAVPGARRRRLEPVAPVGAPPVITEASEH